MAKTERLSDQLVEAVARKVWPQGKAFAAFVPDGHGRVVFGKIHKGLYGEVRVEREGAASPTIGSMRLEDRRDIISKCEKSLNLAAETTSVLAGIVALDGVVRNRSAKRVVAGFVGGVTVWMGARVVGEICDQTTDNINKRIALLDEMANAAAQE